MALTKDAHGLPRFMMDCGWWRNGRKWRQRTLAEMGLHAAGISFANEHSTDGMIPGPTSELAEALSLPLREVTRTLPKLIERGAWKVTDDGDFEIIDFLQHNPSRAEVDADRRRKAAASGRANHQRWHVEKNVTDPDCDWCPKVIPPSSDSESGSDANGNGRRSPYGSKEVSMDGRKEGTSSSSLSDLHPPSPDREEETPRWAILEAERRLRDRDPGLPRIVNPAKWVKDVAREDVWPAYAATVASWVLETDPAAIAARIARLAEPDRYETAAEQGARMRLERGA